ncbi:hypothetical protein Q75_17375 [Bacillus coahuilensis p1.1.43]|uniref:YaaC n=2 Tax=Bacillus coahuilensis TaxID=408580 RepID=A0A147K3U2_9BACI|nr:hypothetical protein Q75_17375 [Bacillus coahuilensis p1.1.43]
MYYASSSTQRFLKKIYNQRGVEKYESKSYDNSYPFIYYLEQGEMYYDQFSKAPLALKPLLLYYGYVQLLKAILLTVDPIYPQSSSVLAHGVSTRKRKKQHYSFLEDEVKIQKHGLYPHLAKEIFNITLTEGEKYTMESLLSHVPELTLLFQFHLKKEPLLRVEQTESNYLVSERILDHLHMTHDRFKSYLENRNPFINWEQDNTLLFTHLHPVTKESLPLRYHLENQALYIPTSRSDVEAIPELLIHLLILYNLSMISRYETEWWSELIKTTPTEDYSFIQAFLEVSYHKTPHFIEQVLKSL